MIQCRGRKDLRVSAAHRVPPSVGSACLPMSDSRGTWPSASPCRTMLPHGVCPAWGYLAVVLVAFAVGSSALRFAVLTAALLCGQGLPQCAAQRSASSGPSGARWRDVTDHYQPSLEPFQVAPGDGVMGKIDKSGGERCLDCITGDQVESTTRRDKCLDDDGNG